MKNKTHTNHLGGSMQMAVNDKIEIISNSNPEIYGAVGTIVDIKDTDDRRDIRVKTESGLDIWIDADDAVIY
ncbi:hypothetical protein SAMN05518856_11921 [Paenibacillus sp. OK003]|nr:hypothetical protein SAMN05518856_11921 [Paenibacillus sp. OK003]